MITNPTYTGATHYKPRGLPEDKRIIVPNVHQPIIPPFTFESAQAQLKRRNEEHMSTSSYDFPFSTILKCGECGRSYHGKTTTYSGGRNNVRTYRCAGKYRVNPCKESSDISEPKVSKLFLKFLEDFEFFANQPNVPVDGIDVEKEAKRLAKLIDESANKRKNYARAMGAGKLDYESFEELVDEENQKSKEWQSELDKLQKVTPSKRTMRDIELLVNNLRTKWHLMNDRQRKLAVQQLFEVIVIKKSGSEWGMVGFKIADM